MCGCGAFFCVTPPQGSMWYVADVYAKNLDCHNVNADADEDSGQIAGCIYYAMSDRSAGKAPWHAPHRNNSRPGQATRRQNRKAPAGHAPAQPAKHVKKVGAEIASYGGSSYDDTLANTVVYKVEWAYLLVGTLEFNS